MRADTGIFKKIGQAVGYILMYFIFTTILYYVLGFLNKLPDNWTYYHIAAITLSIVVIGMLVARALK